MNLPYPLELPIVPDANDEAVNDPTQDGASMEWPSKQAAATRCREAL